MRKLVTKDLFAVMRIIEKAKVKDDLKPIIVKAAQKGADVTNIGVEGILTVMECASKKNAEIEIYNCLASIAEVEPAEVENMELDNFIELLQEIAKENDIRNFFKQLSGLVTSRA